MHRFSLAHHTRSIALASKPKKCTNYTIKLIHQCKTIFHYPCVNILCSAFAYIESRTSQRHSIECKVCVVSIHSLVFFNLFFLYSSLAFVLWQELINSYVFGRLCAWYVTCVRVFGSVIKCYYIKIVGCSPRVAQALFLLSFLVCLAASQLWIAFCSFVYRTAQNWYSFDMHGSSNVHIFCGGKTFQWELLNSLLRCIQHTNLLYSTCKTWCGEWRVGLRMVIFVHLSGDSILLDIWSRPFNTSGPIEIM